MFKTLHFEHLRSILILLQLLCIYTLRQVYVHAKNLAKFMWENKSKSKELFNRQWAGELGQGPNC